MRAKDPAQYKQAWQWHIDQLASLALAANIPYHHYVEVKATLEGWLTEAVTQHNLDEAQNG